MYFTSAKKGGSIFFAELQPRLIEFIFILLLRSYGKAIFLKIRFADRIGYAAQNC
jgi:hypothetical protein